MNRAPRRRAGGRCALEPLELRRLLSSVVVTTLADITAADGQTSLREAIAAANSGDTVSFASGLTGIITLNYSELSINKNLNIVGPGASKLGIDAQGFSRVFNVGSGVTAAIRFIAMSHGFAADGGAISNSGNLTLQGVGVSDSNAKGQDAFEEDLTTTPGRGGGIFNAGKLTILASTLANNRATGGNGAYGPSAPLNNVVSGDRGLGGAIFNDTGASVTASDTGFLSNEAHGGIGAGILGGSAGGEAEGGAIYSAGSVTLSSDRLEGNAAIGGTGGNGDFAPGAGGNGEGGALFSGAGTLTITGATLAGNRAVGGGPGPTIYGNDVGGAASGGAIYSAAATTLKGCKINNNLATAGETQDASGGGVTSTGSLTVTDSTVSGNKAIAGNSDTSRRDQDPTPNGGVALGGGIAALSGSVSVAGSTLVGNSAIGGRGGDGLLDSESRVLPGAGGRAEGGGILIWTAVSPVSLVRSTFAANSVKGGNGGAGVADTPQVEGLLNANGGDALGGGIAGDFSNVTLTACTVAGNSAVAGAKGSTAGAFGANGTARGGGVGVVDNFSNYKLFAANSIIATNSAPTGPDASGLLVSSGFNLIGKTDGSSGWISSDKKGTAASPLNPKLGALGNHGGPTQVIPLLAGSPAIDAGKAFGLTTDQRGLPRTNDFAQVPNAAGGDGTDIGAVELTVLPGGPSQTPFRQFTVGSAKVTLQAEDFDNGGEGVAYHDVESTNRGGAYRGEGVDIETTGDAGGGFHVGYTRAGEWLEYTVDVTEAGTYDFAFRVAAAAAGGKFHVEVDGANATGSLSVPNTGSSRTWTTITKTGVNLPAGKHVLRLSFDTAATNGALGNFNWFSILRTSAGKITTILSDSATYVRDGVWATTNFGTTSELLVKTRATDYNRETYIKFDLGSVATVGSATLRLYGNLQTTETPAETIGVYSVNGAWSEGTVTWNTKPSATTKVASFTVSGTPAKWYEVDLTSYLKAEKAAGHATASIALKSLTPGNSVCTFWSDELVNGPQLVVTAA